MRAIFIAGAAALALSGCASAFKTIDEAGRNFGMDVIVDDETRANARATCEAATVFSVMVLGYDPADCDGLDAVLGPQEDAE